MLPAAAFESCSGWGTYQKVRCWHILCSGSKTFLNLCKLHGKRKKKSEQNQICWLYHLLDYLMYSISSVSVLYYTKRLQGHPYCTTKNMPRTLSVVLVAYLEIEYYSWALEKPKIILRKKLWVIFPFFFFFYNYSPSYICGTQQEIETNIKSGIWRNKLGQGGGKRKMFIHIWPIVELEYKYSFIALICICLNLIQYGSSHFTVYQTAWALTAMLTKNVLPLVKHMLTLFQFYIKGCIIHKMVGKKRQFF